MAVTTRFLEDFASTWNRHDCEGLLTFVTDDATFDTSAGTHPFGDRYQGAAALRAAFPRIWETFPDARWEDATHVVCGERGFSEWTFRGTDSSGNSVEMRGVDIFTFRDGKILRKDTYRKHVRDHS